MHFLAVCTKYIGGLSLMELHRNSSIEGYPMFLDRLVIDESLDWISGNVSDSVDYR